MVTNRSKQIAFLDTRKKSLRSSPSKLKFSTILCRSEIVRSLASARSSSSVKTRPGFRYSAAKALSLEELKFGLAISRRVRRQSF